jgi:ribosomal-protein-alanine N-acetyltransferase
MAARRVAEKCGYKLEGTLRQFFFTRGEYVDYVQYSLLRNECPSLAEALKA